MPTVAQAYGSVKVCQMLSNFYQVINVFRYDRVLKTIYIQAGINDEFSIIINQEGIWEFVE
ncbi:DUF6888 family protein [Laspinema olomoucense]|uniref:DUF6888 family protein n=1 Tax=Laspinema olomoucense TaxID=3231600 RepID=UPI0021BAB517|nr:hypothetical protein [Laspinema sp. D3a]MCT7989511.1 hypothetical protein [Laspinema sp. D3a]